MAEYEDRSWSSRDGLRLHFRDYAGSVGAGSEGRPPVICLPGLTRNARDFEDLAARLAGSWRVLCVELRGRGDSDYARDPMSYNPLQYVDDVEALLQDQGIDRFVAVGTSLGGLLTMMLAASAPERIAAAVLNDIGPEVEIEGLDRIRDYVGQGRSFETWMHAARALQESQGDIYPDFDTSDWLRIAKRAMALGSGGRIAFDYDMKIAEPLETPPDGAPAPDLWPVFDSLAGRPLLLLRGAHSDILSPETAARMAARNPDLELVTIPRVGHAPTLDEPEAVAAIDRLLARIA
ncbi:alpha/beta hydrolase [Novosphingobium sp. KCTC 2891]|uniref:alpha/beta fold hydrolase n=1 Tax=Novosphingobium sp. KCTC 2891 TaxID=2989730 RepID=UPI00222150D8|nr:alpha/beta hydrolase [Novosphingobium sp. KCTC 2891]MCW1382595.1 alpha/beta hydrolase [Novosphingobium sp. KCTC 2891]